MGIVAFFALSASFACGGAPSPEPTTAGTPPASTEAPAAGAAGGVKWDAMSPEQKMTHMKTVVMPKMAALFQSADAEHYKDAKCTLCHGEGAKQGKFTMPNASLPKLNPEGGFKKHMDAHPDATKFMMAKVVPEMAGLLGEAPYDPATKKGFGCFDCHMMEK